MLVWVIKVLFINISHWKSKGFSEKIDCWDW